MGIPGLLNACQTKMRFIKATFLADRHIHVDGLNFVTTLARDVSPTKATGVLDEVQNNLRRNIDVLREYNPKSLTFYFDSFHPLDKKTIRAARKRRNLKELKTHRQVCHMSVLAVKFLIENNIRVVYTGLEAEDEIIKVISERSQAAKNANDQHLIFSSDSDLFTFRLKCANHVEVIPIAKHKIRKAGVDAINMGAVHKAGLVSEKLMRPVPSELEGRSTVASRPMSSVLDMVNQGKVHGKFHRSPPLIYAPDGSNPHLVGTDIRRAAYGMVLRKWFDEEHWRTPISEGVQENGEIHRIYLQPLVGQELEDAKTVLLNHSIPDIVANQVQAAPAQFAISAHEVEAFRIYLRDLIAKADIRKTPTISSRTHTLFPLLKSLLCAILIWEEAVGGPLAKDNLLWRITPHELDAYL